MYIYIIKQSYEALPENILFCKIIKKQNVTTYFKIPVRFVRYIRNTTVEPKMGFYVGCELSVSEINYPNLILGSNPDFPRVSPSLQIHIPCFLVQGWTAAVPWHWLRHRSRTQTPPSLRSSVAPPHPPRGITRLRFVALFSDHFLTRHWVALPGIVYIKMLEKTRHYE